MLVPPLLLGLLAGCSAAPTRAPDLAPPYLRPSTSVTRNLTHMSPLLRYTGPTETVYAPPGTLDGSMSDDISGSHHLLRTGASLEFDFAGSVFVINGWSDAALLKVREIPLDQEGRLSDLGGADRQADQDGPEEEIKEEYWKVRHWDVGATDVSEGNLVAVIGDEDDGPRRIQMDVVEGEVWVSRVIASTEIPPSDEWGAPHWPIIEGWRGVREYMGADIKGLWRETYVDFSGIGIEQPVAWALGSYSEPDTPEDDYATVTLSPAPGVSYLELRGATPLPSLGSGVGRYRVRLDPHVPGHNDSWHTVESAGDTPADIVLASVKLDQTTAYTVTLDMQGVGWHWANAWFLAEMGVQPLPRWIGHWGRVRRVLDEARKRMAFIVAGAVALAAVVVGFVIARRRVAKVGEEDEERQPLLADRE